jgi:glycine betaine catabolism B
VFVCGPNVFMQHVKDTLQTMGFPMTQFQAESFGGAPAKSVAVGTNSAVAKPRVAVAATSFINDGDVTTIVSPNPPKAEPIDQDLAIRFKTSGQTASSDGSLTILEVADEAGVSLRSACRMGGCGACKVQTCGAKVRYEGSPAALASLDAAGGEVLACVAYPVESLTVEA